MLWYMIVQYVPNWVRFKRQYQILYRTKPRSVIKEFIDSIVYESTSLWSYVMYIAQWRSRDSSDVQTRALSFYAEHTFREIVLGHITPLDKVLGSFVKHHMHGCYHRSLISQTKMILCGKSPWKLCDGDIGSRSWHQVQQRILPQQTKCP